MADLNSHSKMITEVQHWLEKVVIGLNLCPFASKPFKQQQIRTMVCDCKDESCLLEALYNELQQLEKTDSKTLETSIMVVPNMLADFEDYNQFLDLADALIEQNGWSGIFQIASFHPDYQFAGTEPEDSENLTNRSPYPLLHLLREHSLEKAIARYPNPEQIPENNIKRVNELSEQEKRTLFPFIFGAHH